MPWADNKCALISAGEHHLEQNLHWIPWWSVICWSKSLFVKNFDGQNWHFIFAWTFEICAFISSFVMNFEWQNWHLVAWTDNKCVFILSFVNFSGQKWHLISSWTFLCWSKSFSVKNFAGQNWHFIRWTDDKCVSMPTLVANDLSHKRHWIAWTTVSFTTSSQNLLSTPWTLTFCFF